VFSLSSSSSSSSSRNTTDDQKCEPETKKKTQQEGGKVKTFRETVAHTRSQATEIIIRTLHDSEERLLPPRRSPP